MNTHLTDFPARCTQARLAWLTRPLRWTAMAALAASGGAGVPATAQIAGVAAADDDSIEATEWAEGDTVRDLLRADAQAARGARSMRQAADWIGPTQHAGRAPPAGPASGQGGHLDPIDHIDLRAIYGVGKSLHAEVSVNGRLARYRAGHATPLESSRTAPAEPYTLLAIDVPCVRLRKAGTSHTACLSSPDATHD